MDDVRAAGAEFTRQEGGQRGFRLVGIGGPVLTENGGVRSTGAWLAAEVISISCR